MNNFTNRNFSEIEKPTFSSAKPKVHYQLSIVHYPLLILLCLLFGGTAFAQSNSSWVNSTGIYSKYNSETKFSKDGIYAGYNQGQELLDKRTRNGKTFTNGDGTNTLMLMGNLHYQNEIGEWDDIDLTVRPYTGNNLYDYANLTNTFRTFYPANPQSGVTIENGGKRYILAKEHKISVAGSDAENVLKQKASTPKRGDYRVVTYSELYSGIDYQCVQLSNGVETGFWIKERGALLLTSGQSVKFEQTIEIPAGCHIEANGKKQSKTFTADGFVIRTGNDENDLYYNPVVIYDATYSFDDIMMRVEGGDGKTENKDNTHRLSVSYDVEINGNTAVVSYSVPAEWLNASNVVYPVFVDPSVTVGTTSAGNEDYCGTAFTHWYGYMKHVGLYLSSELNFTGTITNIGYYCTESNSNNHQKTGELYLKTTTSTSVASGTTWANWKSGATTAYNSTLPWTSGTGWKTINLSSSFSYSSGNLLVITKSNYGGSGNTYKLARFSTSTTRATWYNQDSSDPGDNVTISNNNTGSATALSSLQITYTAAPTAPSNSTCANATTLNCGATLNGTTVGTPGTAHGLPSSASTSNYGVWYTFVGTDGETTLTSTTTFDHELSVVSGSCGNFTWVGSKDGSTSTETYTFNTTSGTRYYVYVAHYSATGTTTGTFSISRTCTTYHSLAVNASPGAGGTVSPTSGSYGEGATVTLTATPAAGYRFSSWSVSGAGSSVSSTTTSTTTFTMGTANATVTANFTLIPTHTLTVNSNPTAGGSVSPTSGTYYEGQTVNITATPASGYALDSWTVSGTGSSLSSTTATTTTFTMGTANATVTANFLVPETSGGSAADCGPKLIYVSTSGSDSNNGSSTAPVKTVSKALTLATGGTSTNHAIIRVASGTYDINAPLNLISNVIIDGQWTANTTSGVWKKGTAETIINRTASNVEGSATAPRIVAIEGSSKSNFKLQDVKVTTAAVTTSTLASGSATGSIVTGTPSYSEDFESTTGTAYSTAGSMPSGWFSYTTATGSSIVAPHVCSGSSYNYYHSGSQSLNLESGTNANNIAYAVMPVNTSGNSVLSFYYRQENDGSGYGTLQVGYVSAQTAQACGNFNSIITITPSTTLHQEVVNISSVPANAYIAFKWQVTAGTYYACCIDDIEVYSTGNYESTTIVTASDYGISTYAVHLSNCNNYDIIRCNLQSGNASAGRTGASGTGGSSGSYGTAGNSGGGAGSAGTNSVSSALNGGKGGAGGTGKSGLSTARAGSGAAGANASTTSGTNGKGGAAVSGGVGKGEVSTCTGNPGTNGNSGTNGIAGSAGTTVNPEYGTYFIPKQSAKGGNGTGGGGGSGGGGGGNGTYSWTEWFHTE
ncbi:MAG: hypothetical protein IKP45_12900 [Bacteroidales bacterium]|nr:hypothetical protein [Bacteroidales bacterium]